MNRGDLNVGLSYFLFLSMVAGVPLAGVSLLVLVAAGIGEGFAQPISIVLALTMIAIPLAARWRSCGFVPKTIDPRHRRKYRTGQVLVAAGNSIVLTAIVPPHLLNDGLVTSGPLLLVALLTAIIVWIIGQTKIKNSALSPR